MDRCCGTVWLGETSEAFDVNDNGQIAGGSHEAFRWSPGSTPLYLGAFPSDYPGSIGGGINARGDVVGWSWAGNVGSPQRRKAAILWTQEDGLRDLGSLSSGGWSVAGDINDTGTVVGSADGGAGPYTASFLWTEAGGMVNIGDFGGLLSAATGINNDEEVVGYSRALDGYHHAFIWTAATGMQRLNEGGGLQSQAGKINESGDIAGWIYRPDGAQRAVRWSSPFVSPALVNALVSLPDGKVVFAGGPLSTVRQRPVHMVGRLGVDGCLDEGFIPFPSGTECCLYATAIQPNGGVLAGGRNMLVRLLDGVTPTMPPPSHLRVASVVGNVVTLRWTPPSSGDTPTGYVIEGGLFPGQTLATIPTGSAYPAYTFPAPTGSFFIRARAVYGAAVGPASNEEALHVNVPVAPTAPENLLGLVNGSALELSWRSTFEGGAPSGAVLDVTGAANLSIPLGATEHFSFVPVPVGTYTFRVRQTNAAGTSPPSDPVTLSFPLACSGSPQAPATVVGYHVGNTVFVAWDPPETGPAPTYYVLDVTGAYTGQLTTTGRGLSGTAGRGAYTVRVRAANPCGFSPFAPAQVVVVP